MRFENTLAIDIGIVWNGAVEVSNTHTHTKKKIFAKYLKCADAGECLQGIMHIWYSNSRTTNSNQYLSYIKLSRYYVQLKLTKNKNKKWEEREGEQYRMYIFSNSFGSHFDSFVWNAYSKASKASKPASQPAILCHHRHSRWLSPFIPSPLPILSIAHILYACAPVRRLYALVFAIFSVRNKTNHCLHLYSAVVVFLFIKANTTTAVANHTQNINTLDKSTELNTSFH